MPTVLEQLDCIRRLEIYTVITVYPSNGQPNSKLMGEVSASLSDAVLGPKCKYFIGGKALAQDDIYVVRRVSPDGVNITINIACKKCDLPAFDSETLRDDLYNEFQGAALDININAAKEYNPFDDTPED